MAFTYINEQTRRLSTTCLNLVLQNAIVFCAMMAILGLSFVGGKVINYVLESSGVSVAAAYALRQVWFIGFSVVSICVTFSGVFATLRLAFSEVSARSDK